MDFTREPIIETVVTPKEGCKIVVRNSKLAGQEEYFVDALEVVSFGQAVFYRSLERPKSFLLPITDYEILEVREAKMVLKNATIDRAIKIGGGKEKPVKEVVHKEPVEEMVAADKEESALNAEEASLNGEGKGAKGADARLDKRRDRRRNYKKKRGREDTETAASEVAEKPLEEEKTEEAMTVPRFANLLAPPPTLISETIARYKSDQLFSGVFYPRENEEMKEDTIEDSEEIVSEADLSFNPSEELEPLEAVSQNSYGSFLLTPEEEADIARVQEAEKGREALDADNSFCAEPVQESEEEVAAVSEKVQEEIAPTNWFEEKSEE